MSLPPLPVRVRLVGDGDYVAPLPPPPPPRAMFHAGLPGVLNALKQAHRIANLESRVETAQTTVRELMIRVELLETQELRRQFLYKEVLGKDVLDALKHAEKRRRVSHEDDVLEEEPGMFVQPKVVEEDQVALVEDTSTTIF